MTLSNGLLRSLPLLAATLLAASAPAAAGSLEVLGSAAAVGSQGLKVTLETVCMTDDVVVPGPTVNTDQVGCTSVTAGNTQVIAPGASFRTAGRTNLQNGFTVDANAPFSIFTDPFVATAYAFVEDGSPNSETVFNAQFKLDVDNLNLAAAEDVQHFVGRNAGGVEIFRVILRNVGAVTRLVLQARDGGSLFESPSTFALLSGVNDVLLTWSAGSFSGEFTVSVNGSTPMGLTGLDNPADRIDSVRWGLIDGPAMPTSTGFIECDDYLSWR